MSIARAFEAFAAASHDRLGEKSPAQLLYNVMPQIVNNLVQSDEFLRDFARAIFNPLWNVDQYLDESCPHKPPPYGELSAKQLKCMQEVYAAGHVNRFARMRMQAYMRGDSKFEYQAVQWLICDDCSQHHYEIRTSNMVFGENCGTCGKKYYVIDHISVNDIPIWLDVDRYNERWYTPDDI